MIRMTIRAAGLIGLASCAAFGQAPAAPAFDVASVKLLKMSDIEKAKARDSIESSPGGLTMRNVSLRLCLQWAYDVKDYQVSGPLWVESERYEIMAKAAGPASDREMKPMLQALLADRFKLTLHREKKDLPVYALIQGKNPPKLQPSDETWPKGLKIVGRAVTLPHLSMPQLADMLTRQMDRPVVDLTGLTGFFDLTVDVSATAGDGGPGKEADRNQMLINAKMMMGQSLLSVLQDQLGLKVEARKLPADALIVDHGEKVPTEN